MLSPHLPDGAEKIEWRMSVGTLIHSFYDYHYDSIYQIKAQFSQGVILWAETLVVCSWREDTCSPSCTVTGVDFQDTFSDSAAAHLPAGSIDVADKYRCSLISSGGESTTICQLPGVSTHLPDFFFVLFYFGLVFWFFYLMGGSSYTILMCYHTDIKVVDPVCHLT